MFDLLLLGAPQIVGSDGPITGRGVQRRRVAILALLGCAPGQVMSRDKLIALLWPESRTDTARHRLSVALHELRRTLGEEAVVSRGDDICLNTAAVRIDVAQFETHCNRSDWKHAIDLYRGPLLDGFFLDDAPEFERWVEETRAHYARMYGEALESHADAFARSHDTAGELEVRRMLAAHDPFSSRAALQLIRVLVSRGDRSAALLHARVHADRLRDEFDAQPDAEFIDYVTQLRATASAVPERRSPSVVALEPIAATGGARRRGWPRTIVAAMVPLMALAGWTAWSTLASSEAPVTRVAVLPFTISGGSGLEYLREGMVDLLSTNMNGAGDVRTIDPHALFDVIADRKTLSSQVEAARAHLGANSYITGTIYVAGEKLRVNASLYEVDSPRPVSTATVDGLQADIFAVVDEVTTQLIGNALQRPGDRPVRIAAATTRSVPALKAYLEGERAFRVGRFVSAADAFARAATLDTTFAIANYRLALSMLWADVPDTLPFEPEARALKHSASLPTHDQQLIRAFVAWRNGDAEEAERIYRAIVRMYPDDSEAWHQLGETLYHYNPLAGRSISEADYAFERAAALDSRSWAALWHRALIAASARKSQNFSALVARLKTMEPEPAQLLELEAVDAYTRRDSAAIARLQPQLARAAPLQLFQLAWRLATLGHDPQAAERMVRLALAQNNSHALRPGYSALAALGAARGDRQQVDSAISALARLDGNGMSSTLMRAEFAVNPVLHYTQSETARILADVIALEPKKPREGLTRLHAAALLAASLGRKEELRKYAEEFAAGAAQAEHPEAHAGSVAGLRARIAVLEGKPDRALELLNSARNEVWFGWAIGSTYWSQVADRYLRAELLRKSGRYEEALRWYESIEEFSANDLAWLGAARARRAEMLPLMQRAAQPKR